MLMCCRWIRRRGVFLIWTCFASKRSAEGRGHGGRKSPVVADDPRLPPHGHARHADVEIEGAASATGTCVRPFTNWSFQRR